MPIAFEGSLKNGYEMSKYTLCISIILASVVQPLHAQCVTSGFYGEQCTKCGETRFSTIFWKAEYQCYLKYGVCEADGENSCGWRHTEELDQCVQELRAAALAVDLYSD
jgi:hypothetical protein